SGTSGGAARRSTGARSTRPAPRSRQADRCGLEVRMGSPDVLAAVVESVARILNADDVDAAGRFFGQGGDSLRAVVPVAALEGRFGIELPVETVFDADDLAGIAASVEAELLASADSVHGP